MKILLIEDDKNTAEAVKTGLKSHYYTVDSVFTGGEGEINAEVNDYDLVIIDIMLPDIDVSKFVEGYALQESKLLFLC